MRRHELWIVSCTVLWLSACSTLPRPVLPDNQNVARREAEVRTRWVGVTKRWTKTCPVPGTLGWTVRPLFPLQELDPKLRRSARNAKLHRLCVYEYNGELPKSRKLELPPAISARLQSVEPDRVALSGMAGLWEITPEPFSERFSEEVQIPAPADLPVAGTSKVRLVFLDTQPTGEGIPATSGLSPHGYTLAHIAGRLAGPLICQNGSNAPCAIEVASRLALPIESFNPWTGVTVKNPAAGGHRGTFVDLSDALWAEFNAWQAIPSATRPRLVLNLSAGWDGEKLAGWDEDLSGTPEIKAVYDVLKLAATQGALVIAAAGNERGGPLPTSQPLLPGGWEKPYRRSQGVWGWTSPGQPFIYAASGIDGQGHPLVNTREKGEASRVAYADHVVVPKFNGGGYPYTATLTGTSVAAAVISTIAAVVWSYRPDLTTPEQVMATLAQSAEILPRKHDFSAPAPVQDVRRITLCRALSQAWNTTLDCGAEGIGIAQGPITGFTPDGFMSSTQTSFFPATVHTDLRDDPWIGPQPAMDPCPTCTIDPPGGLALLALPTAVAVVANASFRSLQETTPPVNSSRLLIEIPSNWAAGDLKQATLEIFGFNPVTGRKVRLDGYSIPAPSLGSNNTLEVTFDQPSEPFQAALSFVLAPPAGAPPGTTRSVISPLFVNSSGN